MGDVERHAYASSPCMLHEFEGHDEAFALRILYLRIEESADGFRWQVRLHDAPEPIAFGTAAFGSQIAARNAGQAALSKACGQFRALKQFG